MPRLTDGVVTLRPLRDTDVDALVDGCTDPLVRRFTANIPDPYTPDDARRFIALQERLDDAAHFAIAPADDEAALLGMVGIDRIDRAAGTARAGYWVRAAHRGRGVATRALRLAVGYAAERLPVTEIRLAADLENPASHSVAERAGFVRCDRTIRARIGGRMRDAFEYRLPLGQ